MGSTSVPANEKPSYWVRIQYDPDADHYLVSASHSGCPNVLVIDGYEASKIENMYKEAFFHMVEDHKRLVRMQVSHEREKQDTSKPSPSHCGL